MVDTEFDFIKGEARTVERTLELDGDDETPKLTIDQLISVEEVVGVLYNGSVVDDDNNLVADAEVKEGNEVEITIYTADGGDIVEANADDDISDEDEVTVVAKGY